MKIVFLDADGTLFHHTGYIPESAIKACIKAQSNGHKICLCTGRQKIEIFGDLLKIDYDGIIAGSGASILVHDKSIEERSFSLEEFNKVHHFLETNQIPALYESGEGLYGYKRTKDKLYSLLHKQCSNLSKEALKKHGLYKIYQEFQIVDDVKKYPINKISFLESDMPYRKVVDSLKNDFDIIPSTFEPFGKESGEIASKSITKATGMDVLMKYYNIDDKDTIAIGDGYNDLCMFERANISVAMENADEKVKEKATRITTSITNNGVYNAFKDLNLI